MAAGNPFWHSFWACGKNTEEAPYRAEIDVFETMSANGKYNYTTHLWWDTTANNLPTALINNKEGCISSLLTGSVTNSTLTSEFHTYGCKWTDTSLTYYFDGEIIAEVVYSQSANSEYFIALKNGNPISLFLSFSTARKYAGVIDNVALSEQIMLVDYVRVYQDTSIGG